MTEKKEKIQTHIEINLRQLKRIISMIPSNDMAVMLFGGPGIGKTEIVYQLAQENGAIVKVLTLRERVPTEVGGVPTLAQITEEDQRFMVETFTRAPDGYKSKAQIFDPAEVGWKTVFALPSEIVKLYKIKDVYIFLDELNICDETLQATAYKIILDRMWGDVPLPKTWKVFAAGNRPEDGMGVHHMDAALRDRFLGGIYYVIPDVHVWIEDYATKEVEKGRPPIHSVIVRFLEKFPNNFYNIETEKQEAFPTPRSWSAVSKWIRKHPNWFSPKITGEEKFERRAILEGLVGAGVATTFEAYIGIFEKVPSPGEVLDGIEADLSTENIGVDGQWSFSAGLIEELLHRLTKERSKKKERERLVLRFLEVLEQHMKGDMIVHNVRLFLRRASRATTNMLVELKEWDKWSEEFAKYI